MSFPCLEINVRKLEANARFELALLARHGITVMGVNKVFNGLFQTAEAIVRGGFKTIAESRIENLKGLAGLSVEKCLLKSPGLSEIEGAIQFADISLNSDPGVIRALGLESARQKRRHGILLMVDMGDLREGIWFENFDEITAALTEVLAHENLWIYGLGTNFNCFGAIKPTVENGERFVRLARRLESHLGIRFPFLSGGNCTSFHLIEKGTWPEGINHLRIGGLHEFGIEYVETKYVDGFFHSDMDISRVCSNLFRLKAEIIEINRKPTVPVGESGVDAFLQPKTFVDRGIRKRALLSVGRQDLPYQNIWPVDPKITMLGQTSDHTLIDIDDSETSYQVGDVVTFELDYTALLAACASNGIRKVFVHD